MSMTNYIHPDPDLDLRYLGLVPHPKTGIWVTKEKADEYTESILIPIKATIHKQLLEESLCLIKRV